MTTTTSYGTWNNHGDRTEVAVEASVATYLNGGPTEWVEQCQETGALDAMVDAYRAAINAALPDEVALCGDEFYGPYYAEDRSWGQDLNDEIGRLDIAAIIEDIDLGKIVEAHDPDLTEDADVDVDAFEREHGYTAAVTGPWCELTVAQNDIHTYRVDDDGNETPELVTSMTVVDGPTGLPVCTDEDAKLLIVEDIADQALTEAGWERTGPWDVADNALYAPVTRTA